VQLCDEEDDDDDDYYFCPFHINGAPVEWNWQGKTEVLGEKPVSVPLCPTQIPHGLTTGSNPGLCGWRPAANRLSHGTARIMCLFKHSSCPTNALYSMSLHYNTGNIFTSWTHMFRSCRFIVRDSFEVMT
jgi:hypothetical protein